MGTTDVFYKIHFHYSMIIPVSVRRYLTLTPNFGLIVRKARNLSAVTGQMETLLGHPTPEPKIVVLSDVIPPLEELHDLPKEARIIFRGSSAADFATREGKEALRQADVILNTSWVGKVERNLLRSVWPQLQENLKWIATITAGMDSTLFPELVNSDVVCTNGKGIYSSPLAEHAIMSIIYFAKDVPQWIRNQKAKKWEQHIVSEARGSTLGVLGFGQNGRACGRLAKALGMTVLAQRRRPELCLGDVAVDEFFGPEGVGDVIESSDYICLTAALTPETRHMVGAAELARAKRSAVIINLGRGSLIDEAALVSALEKGRLRGAALDVFETEPLPANSPLWDMDNVLLSPHDTDLTGSSNRDAIKQFTGDVQHFIDGSPPASHIVDKASGY